MSAEAQTAEDERIENDDYSSQLRSLRFILGKNFKQLSTPKLAAMTGILATAIQATEAGRRQLNDEDRESIELRLGACWNQKLHKWVCARDNKVPYTRKEYEFFTTQTLPDPKFVRANLDNYHRAVDQLMGSLEPQEANIVLIRLSRALQQIDPRKATR